MPTLIGYPPDAFDFVSGSSNLVTGDQFRLDPSYDSDTDALSFEITDGGSALEGDAQNNETGDDSSQDAVVKDASGSTMDSGQIYIEDARTITTPDGSTITVYKMEIGGTHVGWLTSDPLQPGVTYEVDSSFNITGSPADDGDGDGDGAVAGNAPEYDDISDATYDSDADNSILGGDLADDIEGGAGNDTIEGGAGNDTMAGGSGNDSFILTAGGGDDSITDFTIGEDHLETSLLDDGSGGQITADEVGVVTNGDSTQTLQFPNGESVTVSPGTIDTTSFASQFASLVSMGVPPCFAPGTLIQTSTGDAAVETLRIGDMVMTADRGLQALRWIGRRVQLFKSRKDEDKPVLFQAGSLGGGLPHRDLVVSPQHRMVIAGKAVEAAFGTAEILALSKAMTGRAGIRRMWGKRRIEYYALLFDRHEVIFAEGVATESFRPGPVALESFDPHIRAQIYAIYPKLRAEPVAGLGPPARPIAKRREVAKLMRRDRDWFVPSRGHGARHLARHDFRSHLLAANG